MYKCKKQSYWYNNMIWFYDLYEKSHKQKNKGKQLADEPLLMESVLFWKSRFEREQIKYMYAENTVEPLKTDTPRERPKCPS